MTALNQFERLEAQALWQSDQDSQRRDVFVSFGDATLIIIDRNEVALAHWSLAAIERLNPGSQPALYAPGADAPERLEISDTDMIDAIEKVRRAISGGGAHPGRLRRSLYVGAAILVAVALIVWLPSALARYTARIVPDATRDAIGRDLARELTRLAGQPCQSPAGTRALRLMGGRLFPGEPVTLAVYPAGVSTALSLPGGIILVPRALVEEYETIDVAAATVTAARLESAGRDPVYDLLDFASPLTSMRLITTGEVPQTSLAAFAEYILKQQSEPMPDDAMLAKKLQESGLLIAPYAEVRELAGGDARGLMVAGETPPEAVRPVLSDSNWIALRQICAN